MALRASRRWLSLGFLLLAGGLVVVTTLEQRLWPHMAAAAPRRPGLPEAVPRTYAQALADADRDVASAEVRAAQHPDEWTILESLSRRYSTRARLTGSFDDYAAAQAALDRAFAVAIPGAGPHLAQAALHFSLHRLDAAEHQLDLIDRYAVPPDLLERVEATAMRGDIAFYRGDYDGAARLYRRADAMEPGGDTLAYHWAVYHSHTGRPDLAAAEFDAAIRASRTPLPQQQANVDLQKGLLRLEQGRLDAAMAEFRKADAAFPGFWLVQEHIAETLALQGHAAQAEALYADVVRRTGHPEYMDKLAALARARGDQAAAQAWTARASAEWERRLQLLPEAAYGHALDHYLAAGDPGRALEIARRNYLARPFGEAKVGLAEALLQAGLPQAAREVSVEVLRSPWRSAAAHAVAAQAYAATGDPRLAGRQWDKALAANRHVVAMLPTPTRAGS